jgi:RNA polymerase sigma-70 factor (ECF subfamily)
VPPDTLAVLLRNRGRFLGYLRKRLGSLEEAEDLLQEAYLRGMGRMGALREREKVTAWFTRILKNALIDHYRRRSTEQKALERLAAESSEEAPDPALTEEVCSCVQELLPTLRPEYAEALRHVDLGGARVSDYARSAGISPGNASVRLHRARGAMRRRLLDTCGCCAEHGCTSCDCRRDGGPRARD